jgi:hypothetical protein
VGEVGVLVFMDDDLDKSKYYIALWIRLSKIGLHAIGLFLLS